MAGGADLLALSDLLRAGQEDEQEHSNAVAKQTQEKQLTPGDFGPASTVDDTPKEVSDPNAIWGDDEAVQQDELFYDLDDKRPQPEFDIVYKQSVMAEDNFLGMAGKTPGSQDCTHIVVKVVFPGCRMRDLEVDVSKNTFLAASPKLRLVTYLPLPVDDKKGVAKWDTSSETLSVTLPITGDEW